MARRALQERSDREFTLEQFEELTGLSQRTIVRVFEGREGVDRRTLDQVARKLRVELAEDDIVPVASELRFTGTERGNVPAPVTELIGREAEISRVAAALRAARLVTLTGPGGVGKSRLALQSAHRLRGEFPDGVWFVELADVVDASLLEDVVGAVFDAPGFRSRASSALESRTRNLKMLLVLDNCEHVAAAARALVERLLVASPALSVLATSRTPLASAGEQTLRVGPLAVPPASATFHATDVNAYASTSLFVNRAKLVEPNFKVRESNAEAVAEVVRRVDGIPLALELAAAHMRTMSANDLAAALRRRLDILETPRSGPERQRTLRSMLAWSYGTLTLEGMALVRRMSLFPAAWDVDAAAALSLGDGISREEVVRLLAELVDKSFVLVERRDDEPRFVMLQATREFARDMLRNDERARLMYRLAEYTRRFASAAYDAFATEPWNEWIARMDREQENVRFALAWSLGEGNDLELGVALAAAMTRWWIETARLAEGSHWIRAALAAPPAGDDRRQRARLWSALAVVEYTQGDGAEMREALYHALRLFDAVGDRNAFVDLLAQPVLIANVAAEPASALTLLRGLSLFPELFGDDGEVVRDPVDEILALCYRFYERTGNVRALGSIVAKQGARSLDRRDLERAQRSFERSLLYAARSRDDKLVGDVALSLADVAEARGDYRSALASSEDALAAYERVGLHGMATLTLCRLAELSLERRDVAGACEPLHEVLERVRHGAPELVCVALRVIAELSFELGEPERAATLVAASALGVLQGPNSGREVQRRARLEARLRASLDAATLARAWQRGLVIVSEAALAEARNVLEEARR